ncbi:hypothetical protein LXL04_038197 [Taraxacum kok-saghyz]
MLASTPMEDSFDTTLDDFSKPVWENMVESPIIDYVSPSIPSCKYKLKLKYGGFFRLAKNTCRRIYCFGSQKCIYIDTWSYNLSQLNDEVIRRYSSKNNPEFSISYVDKCARDQSFIELDSDEKFMAMLIMYEEEKEVTIYVTTVNNHGSTNLCPSNHLCDNIDEPHDESDYCPSEESYYSHLSFDNEDGPMNDDGESYSFTKNSLSMKEGTKFDNAVEFKRALNHYAITNEFDYFILKSDQTRFRARLGKLLKDILVPEVTKVLRSDGDVCPGELRKWIMKTYNVEIPYLKVFRGKQQAYTNMYGKWEDSFMMMDVFRQELLNRNHGSVVEIDFDIVGEKRRFKRFFISLAACSRGFLVGCLPYISLDACHLKGKFNGVLAAATGVDGNNSIFPIAYCVLESENTQSWTWFLESLKKAIGTPSGLVISSDMQKGLEAAIMHVYPNVEHRECIRHLCSNFKKQFRGEFFCKKLWGAAHTYLPTMHDTLLKEISDVSQAAIAYLNKHHTKIWSKRKFGTICKCDYSHSWVGAFRYQPVLDLLDAIRGKLMKRFNKKRMLAKKWNGILVPIAKNHIDDISKNLGEYEVCRSGDNHAEVNCRVWQVTGLPCVHAAAFIGFTRDTNWDKYVDSCYTIEKVKEAYAFEIAPMPGMDQWMQKEGDKIYPPIIKRPVGRQKKIELNQQVSLKEDTSVHDVVSMDIVKKHARIPHLKIWIHVNHPPQKGKTRISDNFHFSVNQIAYETMRHQNASARKG